jgi:hypothetical protein
MFEYDLFSGMAIQSLPILEKLHLAFVELSITDTRGNIILNLENIRDDCIEILPFDNGYILQVTNPLRKAISYNLSQEVAVLIRNSTNFDITINGRFSNTRNLFNWVEVFREPGLLYLPVYQNIMRFPIVLNSKSQKNIFSYSRTDGIGLIPVKKILLSICPNLTLIDSNNNILYTIETLNEENILITEKEIIIDITENPEVSTSSAKSVKYRFPFYRDHFSRTTDDPLHIGNLQQINTRGGRASFIEDLVRTYYRLNPNDNTAYGTMAYSNYLGAIKDPASQINTGFR